MNSRLLVLPAVLLCGASAAPAQTIRQSANCAARRRVVEPSDQEAVGRALGDPAPSAAATSGKEIAEYNLVGDDLLEGHATIRGFFDPLISAGQRYEAGIADAIRERAQRLGYCVAVVEVPIDAARTRLVLH